MKHERVRRGTRWLAPGVAVTLATLSMVMIAGTSAQAAGSAHGTSTTTDVSQGTGACLAPPLTTSDPDPVNCNAYADKNDVWLSGLGSGGIPDGTYFFEVVSPGDQNNLDTGNLSTDAQSPERTFTVTNGVVSYGGTHGFDVDKIQIAPFGDTTNHGGVYILAVCPADGGNCKYDAFKVKASGGTGGDAEVPVVTKDADGSYDLTYAWDVTKSVDKTRVEQVGGNATFNYTLSVHHDAGTPSSIKVTGSIDVFNPNTDSISGVTVTDSISDGTTTTCSVTGGSNVSIGSGTNFFDYECDLAALPAGDLSNTATATWGDQDLTDGHLAAGHADFLLTPITLTANAVDDCVNVTDVFNSGAPDAEGTVCVSDPDNPTLIHYSRSIPVPSFGCRSYDNTATVTTDDSSTATPSNTVTVTVCGPAQTSALTIGFWKNTNGNTLIQNYCAPVAKTSLATYLSSLGAGSGPFADAAGKSCKDLVTYVNNVIKGATSTNMNVMLRAQMLATALDVYFSGTGYTTTSVNKTKPPSNFLTHGPLGTFNMDMTAICPMVDNTTAGTATCTGVKPSTDGVASGAFPSAAMTVQAILDYESTTPSPFNGSTSAPVWYAGNRTKEEIAKNAFDQINNQLAFGA